MATDMGEYIVGAYLQLVEKCDFVGYNVNPPGGGREGQAEFDVIGFHFKNKTVYLCEVATHVQGANYGRKDKSTLDVIKDKFSRQKTYSDKYLSEFTTVRLIFWSPRVSVGALTNGLASIDGLELVINEEFIKRVDELRALARESKANTGNPAFRMLQILEALRR